MRVNKKDLNVLSHIVYDDEDYSIYDKKTNEFVEYLDGIAQQELKYVIDEINSTMGEYFIVYGDAGTWQGRVSMKTGYVTDFNAVIRRLSDSIDHITIKWDKDEQSIVIHAYHHDGVNIYYIKKIEWFTKKELRNMIIEYLASIKDAQLYDLYYGDLRNSFKEDWNCTFSNASKAALIDVIMYEILENYD